MKFSKLPTTTVVKMGKWMKGQVTLILFGYANLKIDSL